jgi:hypothetical protein
MPLRGTTEDENYSPPREGCRGGLSRTLGPTPKADAFSPPKRGFSGESNSEGASRTCRIAIAHNSLGFVSESV